jgi:plastocyanin
MKMILLVALCAGGVLLCAAGVVAESADIHMDNFTFGPSALTVPVGTKVTWTNRDDIPHTVVDEAQQRAFKSPPLDTGESFSYMFGRSGTYHFFCSLHPRMRGTVVVK